MPKSGQAFKIFFSVPHNQKEHNRLVHTLDGLIDEVGHESHPLAFIMETLGSLIESYEVQNIPEIEGNPIDII